MPAEPPSPEARAHLVEILRRRARRHPDRPAFVFLRDGEEERDRLSYGELDARTRTLAARLAQRGAAPGERALLLYPPGLELVAAFCACLYAGVVAVPAYPPRAGRRDRRLEVLAADAEPRWALATSTIRDRSGASTDAGPPRERWIATDEIATEASPAWRAPELTAETLAFLQYTSGSTADPKGVRVTHANLFHNLETIRRAFAQSERSIVVGWLPLYHDMGLIGNVLETLYAGASAVLMSPMAFLRRPARWLEAIDRYRATTSGGPDFAYDLCCRKIAPEERRRLDLSSWRVAFDGAEPVRPRTLERFAAAFAPQGFDRRAFYPCYGLAEATLFVAGGKLGAPPRVSAFETAALEKGRAEAIENDGQGGGRLLAGCGRTWGDQRLAVVDPATRRELPPGRIGEIWIAGPSVAAGYRGRREESARTFAARLAGEPRQGPFLRTGDLGFLHRGELFVTGRRKDLILLRGRNLYPQDVEASVAGAHAALEPGGGAAFSVDGPEGERLVVVHELRRRRPGTVDLEEIAGEVRRAVAEEHEARVEELVLIPLGTLPRTSSGKVRRRACRTAYLAGELAVVATSAPTDTAGSRAVEEEMPGREELLALPAEERRERLTDALRRLAARVAGADPGAVAPERPLTTLGLDSLQAVELGAALEEELGVALSPARLLSGASPAELAGELRDALPANVGEAESERVVLVPDGDAHPLTHGQRALWLLERLETGDAGLIVAAAARARGTLDAAALERSLVAIVDRHPALRTTFLIDGGEPRQRVRRELPPEVLVEDASEWSEKRLRTHLAQAAYRPFDLETGPLLRLGIFRRERRETVIFLALHHLVSDLWSVALVLRELETLYLTETGAGAPPLEPPRRTYADHVHRQRRRLASARGETLQTYWRERLAGEPPVLALPADRPRPAAPSRRGGRVGRRLGRDLAARLEAVGRERGATLYMTLLAAFEALLHRLSGQHDFLLGSPTSGRDAAGSGDVVGYFTNPVVLRAEVAGEMAFDALLERVRRDALGAFEHADLPFPLLVERLAPRREPGRSPLFDVFFVFEETRWLRDRGLAAFALGVDGAQMELLGLELESLRLERRRAQFDLMLVLARDRGGLGLVLEHDAELFDATTVRRLLAQYETLLRAAAADPARRVADLPLLDAAGRAQLLVEWAAPADAPAFEETTLPELFAARAHRAGDRVAVIDVEKSVTYRQLAARARRLGSRLRALGVGPEIFVGLCLSRRLDLVAGVLGILEAGGAYVPLDPAYPAERLRFALEDTRAPVVVTEERLRFQVPTSAARTVVMEELAEADADAGAPFVSTARPRNLAYVIYTSGSTGRPKGVAIEHRGAVALLAWARAAFPRERREAGLASTSLCFDLSVFEIFLPLATGGRVILAESALHLPRHPAAGAVTLVNTVPSALAELLRAGELSGSVRAVNLAGEPLRRELVERAYAAVGVEEVWNLYGPSEDTTYSTAERVPVGVSGEPSIGRPIAGTRAHVLDRRGRLLPPGVPGELYLGGAGLARGYLRRPARTAERFVPDGLGAVLGGRLLRTGDRVRQLADGRLAFLGRLDHQVKLRGFRIEPGEIETALLDHPAVREAVVAVRPDAVGGDRLVAWLEAPGDPPAAAELRDLLRRTLPEHMLPAAFVTLAALPRTTNGKVDRAALPEPAGGDGSAPERLPQSLLERRLAAVWRDVLGIDEIGLDQSFFDLGGHSLLMVEVHGRLGEIVDEPPPVVELFRYPTLRGLARRLSGEEAPEPFAAARARGRRGRRLDERPAAERGKEAVAIVGLSGRFPGAKSAEELWRNLRRGVESITRFGDDELLAAGVPTELLADPAYVKARGVVVGIEELDARFFDLSPREAELLDPQHRLLLECAWEALEDAGVDPERHPGAIGVYAGVGLGSYLIHHVLPGLERHDPAAEYRAMIANDKDFVPTRIAYKLGLRGPAVGVQTACSTSLVAVHLACRSLLGHECDLALAGGASIGLPPVAGYLFREGGILSPDGRCRAFAADARGTVPASGAGMVALKRLAEAVRDGDPIHAVVRGSAINNDGAAKVGYTAPGADGQAEVIAAAHAAAGVDPGSITYVEAHGTGTELGDPVEVAALTRAFRAGTERRGFCALGSVKTNLGHLDAASGVAGLIKTALALRHRQIPPTLHCEPPHPEIDFAASPFVLSRELVDWRPRNGPRRAGVSSFGIGGTNAHLVLEEAPAAPSVSDSRPWQLLLLSARSAPALARAAGRLAAFLRDRPEVDLADVAHTLQTGRKRFEHRGLLVCRGREEARELLEARDPERFSTVADDARERPVVFLFPGQGSQYPGMGRSLYETEPVFRETVDRCAGRLERGDELLALLRAREPDKDAARRLRQTDLAQPALFVVEYALARLWMEWGVRPEAMIGHSVGEYVAACLAGVFSLEEALALVEARGRLMAALPPGAMLAAPVPEAELAPLLHGSLALAAVNAPDLCVASGPPGEIEALRRVLAERGVEARPLHTSHAFHSPMMDPALEAFAAELARVRLRSPAIPYLSNLTGRWASAEEIAKPRYWVEHLRRTVRFADGLAELRRDPERLYLEVGPGRALGSLVARAAGEPRPHVLASLRHPHGRDPDLAFLLRTLGRLWARGVEIDWRGFSRHEKRRRVALPTYPFERQRYWLEPGARPASAGRLEKAPPEKWLWVPTWRPRPRPPTASKASPRRWLVLLDGEGLGEALAARLETGGAEVTRVRPGDGFARLENGGYAVHPARRADYDSLLKALGPAPQGVLHLFSLSPAGPAEAGGERFDAASERGFYSLLALVQALAAGSGSEPVEIVALTRGAQEVTGEEELEPEAAPLLGLCRVVPQEIAHLRCRTIDVTLPAAGSVQAERLIDELAAELTAKTAAPAAERAVAYRGARRWVPSFEPLRAPPGAPPCPCPGGVYLILGGLGRIGLELAGHLADAAGARLALVGRTPLPPREKWDAEPDPATRRKIGRVRRLEALGAEVWTGHADIADVGELRRIFDEVRHRFGPLDGVLHAAGEVGEGAAQPLETLRAAGAERHFRAKVRGLYALAELLDEEPDPPGFCLLCSSIAAQLGGLGFAAYAAANLFQDLFARERNRRGAVRWLSVGWDAWRFADDEARAAALGTDAVELALTPAEGVGVFARLLAHLPAGGVIVSTADLEARIERWIGLEGSGGEVAVHPRPELQSDYAAPQGELEGALAGLWGRMLGIDRVGVHDNFFELGGNSLVGVQLMAEVKRRFGVQISPVSLYETPTLRSLARRIEGEARPDEALDRRQRRGELRRRRRRQRARSR